MFVLGLVGTCAKIFGVLNRVCRSLRYCLRYLGCTAIRWTVLVTSSVCVHGATRHVFRRLPNHMRN